MANIVEKLADVTGRGGTIEKTDTIAQAVAQAIPAPQLDDTNLVRARSLGDLAVSVVANFPETEESFKNRLTPVLSNHVRNDGNSLVFAARYAARLQIDIQSEVKNLWESRVVQNKSPPSAALVLAALQPGSSVGDQIAPDHVRRGLTERRDLAEPILLAWIDEDLDPQAIIRVAPHIPRNLTGSLNQALEAYGAERQPNEVGSILLGLAKNRRADLGRIFGGSAPDPLAVAKYLRKRVADGPDISARQEALKAFSWLPDENTWLRKVATDCVLDLIQTGTKGDVDSVTQLLPSLPVATTRRTEIREALVDALPKHKLKPSGPVRKRLHEAGYLPRKKSLRERLFGWADN